jgi:hypothetical protein
MSAKHQESIRYIAKVMNRERGSAQSADNGMPAPELGVKQAEEPQLQVVTARDLCALPDPSRSDELLGPLLVRGHRTVLGAHTGEGKTTLALQMIHASVTAGELLKWRGGGGRALVIDAEQGLRTIKRRLREAGLKDSEDIDYLRVPDGLALDTDEGEIEALEAILSGGGYAVVLADPLYKLHRGDSNDERAAVDLMRRWDEWRVRYDFGLLLTTHPRKRPPIGARFTMDEMFGSGAFMRGAEVVLGLQRPRPGYANLHFFKDRDGDLPVGAKPWGLLFDRESGFRRDPDDAKAKPTAKERVRELLEADPGMTLEKLGEASGFAERTIRKALGELTATGVGKPKQWYLPKGNQEGLL